MPTYEEAHGDYGNFKTEVIIIIEGKLVKQDALSESKKKSKANAAQKALDYIAEKHPNYLTLPMSVSKSACIEDYCY